MSRPRNISNILRHDVSSRRFPKNTSQAPFVIRKPVSPLGIEILYIYSIASRTHLYRRFTPDLCQPRTWCNFIIGEVSEFRSSIVQASSHLRMLICSRTWILYQGKMTFSKCFVVLSSSFAAIVVALLSSVLGFDS